MKHYNFVGELECCKPYYWQRIKYLELRKEVCQLFLI